MGVALSITLVVLAAVIVLVFVYCYRHWAYYRQCFGKRSPPLDDAPPPAYGPALDYPVMTYGEGSDDGGPAVLDPRRLPTFGDASYMHRPTIEPLPDIRTLANAGSRYDITEIGDARLSFESLQLEIIPKMVLIKEEDEDEEYVPDVRDWFSQSNSSFPRGKLEFMDEVGSGWFGQVVSATAMDIVPFPRRSIVYVKLLSHEATELEQSVFLEENRIFRDSDHPNVLKLLGSCIEKMPYMLIYETFPRGSLKSLLLESSNGVRLLDSQGTNARCKMAVDVASGLEWMHKNGLVYQDLATRNCSVAEDNRIVIGDYGLATSLFKQEYFWCGVSSAVPIRWMAPEVLEVTATYIKQKKITQEANIWSFGVLLWEICELGKLPFKELTDEEVLSRVITDRNYGLAPPSITMLPYPSLRTKMSEIIMACCNPLAHDRPSIETVKAMLEIPQ